MPSIISKEELEEFSKVKGNVTGACILSDLEFILRKEGEKGLKRLEDTLANLGYPLKYSEIKRNLTTLYPLTWAVVLIVTIKRLFNYNDKDLKEMGEAEAKISSLIIRLFMRYFVSFEKAAKEAPRMWREHYKVGDLKIVEHDKEKKYVVLRIENFAPHPLILKVLKGYFAGIIKMIVGKDVDSKETKSPFKGDGYCEFLLTW